MIGAVWRSRPAADEVFEWLVGVDFYVPADRTIFAAMRRLYDGNQLIHTVTVVGWLHRGGELGVGWGSRLSGRILGSGAVHTDWGDEPLREHGPTRWTKPSSVANSGDGWGRRKNSRCVVPFVQTPAAAPADASGSLSGIPSSPVARLPLSVYYCPC